MSSAAVTAVPAKKVKVSKKPDHPTYFDMVASAIAELKERTGSSRPAILKAIIAKHSNLGLTAHNYVAMALKKALVAGYLVQVKGSFKLTEAGKKAIAPKKVKPVKVVAPKKLAAKKAAPKKTVAKKAIAKKAVTQKLGTKKTAIQKSVTKKVVVKKSPAKKMKKTTTRKAATLKK